MSGCCRPIAAPPAVFRCISRFPGARQIWFCFVWALVLLPALDATAQCGASVSGCRQCHEIDKQRPVLGDGRPWHIDHAFGDFCVACHGGDRSATDPVAAHLNLVDPLGEPAQRCGTSTCHGEAADGLAADYRRPRAPKPDAAAPEEQDAQRSSHNVPAAIAAVVLALAGTVYVTWNERRRRAPETKP